MYRFALPLLTLCLCSAFAVSPFTNQAWWSKSVSGAGRTDNMAGCTAMCCAGRNSSCFSSGPRIGGEISKNGRCFCDEGCLDMDDCCEDYSLQCQAVDCVVSEWEDYGPCSRACGLGAMTRERSIIQQPRNGGKKCPVLKESTVCKGRQCRSQRHIGRRGRYDQETARIMPAHYGKFRNYKQYNDHLDIRKNLFYRYYAHVRDVEKTGYCALFEVMSSRLSCKNMRVPWAQVLSKGQTICVECQNKAMEGGDLCLGHGSRIKDTFWTAVNAQGCHGWWRRTNNLSECSCNGSQGLDFIFI